MTNTLQKVQSLQHLSTHDSCRALPIIVDGMKAYKFFYANLINNEKTNKR